MRPKGVIGLIVIAGGALPTVSRADDPVSSKQACASASEQGETERDEGKYRAARQSFLTCARETCPKIIAQTCMKWLTEIEESGPRVVLVAKDEQGTDLTQVHV